MAAWPVTAIRQAEPDSHIVWGVQPRCQPVISTPDLVDEIRLFDREGWKWRVWSKKRWREQLGFYFGLRKMNFDVGFDLQGHSKTALALWLAKPKQKWSVGGTDPLAKVWNPVADLKGAVHEVEKSLAVARMWRPELQLPEMPIMPSLEQERAKAREFGPMITLQTGAGGPRKAYPLEYWTQVAEGLKSCGCRLVTVGGPGDPAIPGTEAMNGKLNLRESIGFVAESRIHLAADTGTGHAAAAYGVPVVTVFGPMKSERYHPWTKKGVILHEGLSPANIKPQQMIDAALSLMERC